MQVDIYKTYPKFGSFTFGNTPAGTKGVELAGLFDKIVGLIHANENSITPEMRQVALGALYGAWTPVSIGAGVTGKLNN